MPFFMTEYALLLPAIVMGAMPCMRLSNMLLLWACGKQGHYLRAQYDVYDDMAL